MLTFEQIKDILEPSLAPKNDPEGSGCDTESFEDLGHGSEVLSVGKSRGSSQINLL